MEGYDSDDSDYDIAVEDEAKRARENGEEDEAESGDEGSDDAAEINKLTPAEFKKRKLLKFGQREINNVKEIKERLHEVKQNFYNRLESKKLIKKWGKIPFTEHMTITNPQTVGLAESAALDAVNDDIKRELAFYNGVRENVMKGMQILV